MTFCGYVTVKLQSERVPQKSIQLLAGQPLVNYPLKILNQIDDISKIYLCCSERRVEDYIDRNQKYCFLERPASLDSNEATFNDVLDFLIKDIKEEYIVFLSCTSPFIRPDTIKEMISMIKTNDFDSSFLATKVNSYCWFRGKPLNFSPEKKIPRTQDLEPVIIETSGLYIFSKADYIRTKRRVGKKPFIRYASQYEDIDIDTMDDLNLARIIAETRAS